MTTVAGCSLTVAAVAAEKTATKHCTAIATDGLHMVIRGKKSFTGGGVVGDLRDCIDRRVLSVWMWPDSTTEKRRVNGGVQSERLLW